MRLVAWVCISLMMSDYVNQFSITVTKYLRETTHLFIHLFCLSLRVLLKMIFLL
jgi:hypothetical protein